MHEYSIVRALLSQAIEAATPAPPASIREVQIALGPLSGVEPLLVRQAFDNLKTTGGMENCILDIAEQPLIACCRECECQFEILDFVFRCPRCRSSCVAVTQGDQLLLTKVEETHN